MKRYFLLLLIMVFNLSSGWCNDHQYKSLSKFFQNENSLSVERNGKIFLHPEFMEAAEGGIQLHTNTLGTLHIPHVRFDGRSYFIQYDEALWGMRVCKSCGYMTTSRISECPKCGSRDIEALDNWPND